MSRNKEQVLDFLIQIEKQSNAVLADKHALITLQEEHNRNREALQHFRKPVNNTKVDKSCNSLPNKYYTYFGSSFIKLKGSSVEESIRKDQIELEEKINSIRNGLKDKVRKLKSLQDHQWNTGFDLKPC